jgi:hypothetical protein
MKSKLYSHIFLAATFFILLTIFGFNLLIDPYDVTQTNILKIKHKIVRDGRLQKISRIKELSSIDNLILGSSRSERLNPKTVSDMLGGYTYSFGIGGSDIEDSLGLLLYLEKENKLPKNIILCLDDVSFEEGTPSEGFYKIPELNFLKIQHTQKNLAAKLFSIDALFTSIETFRIHIQKIEPTGYIDENGFLRSNEPTHPGDMESIQKTADYYYDFHYKKGEIKFSQARFAYLKRIVGICKKHHIKLHAMLTPVHIKLYTIIQTNGKLAQKIHYLKEKLSTITPYYDAMVQNNLTLNDINFEDAVHYNEQMGDLLLKELLR